MVTMTLPQTPVSNDLFVAPAVAEDTQAQAATSRSEMIAKHMPLVRYVAGSMARHAGASSIVDYDDLLGYGAEGLIEAVDTFNPTYNVKFSTWAVMHIRTTIQDALRTLDPLPRSLRSKGKEIDRVSYDLANKNGCWPADAEIAAELGVTVAKLRSTMQDINKVCVSLDSVEDAHGEDQGYSWMSSLADEDPEVDPDQALDAAETTVMLGEAVEALPERERAVITAYYRQGRSMRDIAEELGVSESRISQLHARALKMLRTYITESLTDVPRTSRAA
jgi:RNA polymerase sigma factor for flagellar operon FliA